MSTYAAIIMPVTSNDEIKFRLRSVKYDGYPSFMNEALHSWDINELEEKVFDKGRHIRSFPHAGHIESDTFFEDAYGIVKPSEDYIEQDALIELLNYWAHDFVYIYDLDECVWHNANWFATNQAEAMRNIIRNYRDIVDALNA